MFVNNKAEQKTNKQKTKFKNKIKCYYHDTSEMWADLVANYVI